MNKSTSLSMPRVLAAFLVVVLVYSPLFPLVNFTYADDQQLCEYAGRVWINGVCRVPVPAPDETAPILGPHPDVSTPATSADGAVVRFDLPTSDNAGGSDVVKCLPPSDSLFALGTTSVECTATDAAGNVSTPITFNVIIVDASAPVIAPHEDVHAQSTSASGAPVTYTPPATTDDVDGAGVALCTPPSGSTFAVGTTTVTCTASDAAGNGASPTTFDVIVEVAAVPEPDPTPPPTGGTTPPPTTNDDPSTNSSSTIDSATVAPSQSDSDNTDFEDIIDGPLDPCAETSCTAIDKSATTTEMAAPLEPLFVVASSTEGIHGQSSNGGSIFTGNAVASTTVKNTLNITRSNVDGPGETNSSRITADTDNTGDVTTTDETRALTGENTGDGGEGSATIHTGSATASARILNVLNTNFFNSEGQVLFLNPDGADGLDLRDAGLEYFIDGGVGAAPAGLGCTILTCLNSATLKVLNKNEGTVDNEVFVRAATGQNAATTTKEGAIDIETGNAYASAAVLNMVNTNFINSKYLVATFDNFGNMQGDIVLPSASFFRDFFENGNTLPHMNSSSYIVSNDNDETFTGTTTANAITGGNVATTTSPGDGHGEIRTGQAHTSSTNFTAANQTYVGGSSVLFVFHVSGEWSGQVKGLPEGMSSRRTAYGIEVYSNGAVGSTRSPQGIYNSANFIASSTNKAVVNTNVNVWAETGENRALTENGVGKITTGDAYATANVVNMVNTNVVNRNFMFAVFNITGDWSGDIDFGGHSPNLAVQASATGANPAAPGSLIKYRFTVRNNGDVAADNVVLTTAYDRRAISYTEWSSGYSKTDTVTGTSFALGSIPAGGISTIEVTARLDVRLPANSSTQIPLTASVSSSQHDQDDNDNATTIGILVSSAASPPPPPPPPPPSGGTPSGGSPSGGSPSGGSPSGGTPSGGTPSGGTPSGGTPSGGTPSGGTPSGGTPSGGTPSGGTPSTPSNSSVQASVGSPSGGGGGGGASIGMTNSLGQPGLRTSEAQVSVTKTASFATTTAPMNVDYKVVVSNDKRAGPAYQGLLTDTLYDPTGAVMYNRSWDLDAIEPGDQITLTYTVAFGTSTVPGIYHNIARVTAFNNYAKLPYANPMIPVEDDGNVEFKPNGLVLGAATSTPVVLSANITSTNSCAPLLSSYMRSGTKNDTGEVKKLQQFLNDEVGAKLPTTGLFGPLTTSAVKSFQRKYASVILSPAGLLSPTGLVYASTLRKINTLACGGLAPTGTVSVSIAPSTQQAIALSATTKAKTPAKPKAPAAPAKSTPAPSARLNTVGSWFSKLTPKTKTPGQ